jgi:hypothetical protein
VNFAGFGLGSTGVELSADLFNVANFLDRKKGVSKTLGDQNLLNLRRFNQVTQQYEYEVNQNVGVVNPGGTPWQLQVSARVFF